MKLASKYIKGIDKEAIQEIEWVSCSDEPGWQIYLKPGWSFWDDCVSRAIWVSADNPQEAESFSAYKIEE